MHRRMDSSDVYSYLFSLDHTPVAIQEPQQLQVRQIHVQKGAEQVVLTPAEPKSLPELLIKKAYKQPKPKSPVGSASAFLKSTSKQTAPYTLPAALQARILQAQKLRELEQQQQQMRQQFLTINTAMTPSASPKSAPLEFTEAQYSGRNRSQSLPSAAPIMMTDPASTLLQTFLFDENLSMAELHSPLRNLDASNNLQSPESLENMMLQMQKIRRYINHLQRKI